MKISESLVPLVVNGEPREVPPDLTVRELLAYLKLSPDRPGVAVAVNDRVVRRSQWATHVLRPGDRVEIITATQGG